MVHPELALVLVEVNGRIVNPTGGCWILRNAEECVDRLYPEIGLL
jgi:hypothetical protein